MRGVRGTLAICILFLFASFNCDEDVGITVNDATGEAVTDVTATESIKGIKGRCVSVESRKEADEVFEYRMTLKLLGWFENEQQPIRDLVYEAVEKLSDILKNEGRELEIQCITTERNTFAHKLGFIRSPGLQLLPPALPLDAIAVTSEDKSVYRSAGGENDKISDGLVGFDFFKGSMNVYDIMKWISSEGAIKLPDDVLMPEKTKQDVQEDVPVDGGEEYFGVVLSEAIEEVSASQKRREKEIDASIPAVLEIKNEADMQLGPHAQKHLFVMMYTQDCSACEDLLSVWEQVGELIKSTQESDILTIARIDASKINLPVPVTKFPSLMFWNKNDVWIEYTGDSTQLMDILNFIVNQITGQPNSVLHTEL